MTTIDRATPVVAFTGAVKEFGAVRAVDGLDLTIGPGERVALLGRNGAGKSTAIGLLLGLDDPTSGTVELFGRAPSHAVSDGRVGAMLQDSKHYLEEADQNADRIVVIDRGRLIADGSGADIKHTVGSSMVSFTAPDGPLPDELAALPGVLSVEVVDGRVRLRTSDSDATVSALPGVMTPRGLEVAPAGLEDAFLALTAHHSGRDARRPSAPSASSGSAAQTPKAGA
ncbi:ATP-binding cassette domain-containing protein (plasmid) [Streptomyces sp. NBC_01590]|uniref:ATP-binding cassette domain-containing protein n=1 Tax=Streptomyces sp. NBC_01590 TaxID=2975887 RepID=UPI002F917D8E